MIIGIYNLNFIFQKDRKANSLKIELLNLTKHKCKVMGKILQSSRFSSMILDLTHLRQVAGFLPHGMVSLLLNEP